MDSHCEHTVGWSMERQGALIVVRFEGLVDARVGRESVTRLMELLADDEFVHLVFDVLQVTAYRAAARKAWQRVIWPRREQILQLTIASASSITRMGGSMFGAFLGISVSFARTAEELDALLESLRAGEAL